VEPASLSQLFGQLRAEFEDRGLLRRALRMEREGRLYSVRCDQDCFTVYRVNQNPHLPPGLPGWMVCRVTAWECFSLDENEAVCVPAGGEAQLAEAHFWARAALDWLTNLPAINI
jgi:hypothetical protein